MSVHSPVDGRPAAVPAETPETGGLRRSLSGRQIGMISIGGTIGTGLFLGSGLAISLAGPAVLVAYAAGAIVAVLLAYALAEMTVEHPEAGGFGAVTRRYLGPLAGFVQRWIYWTTQVIISGSEVVAVGLYVRYWWPQLPLWTAVTAFGLLILAVNLASVRLFGEVEYWSAMIKVTTIVVFIVCGLAYVFLGLPGHPATGVSAWTADGGFAPHGVTGVVLALAVVTLSYGGVEAFALSAAESRDPARDLPRAARGTVARLVLFYLLSTAVLVSIVPWRETAGADGIKQSPFVRLFDVAGVPAAAGLMNFVVLTAALSAANSQLYIASRTMFSLSRDKCAPAALGRVGRQGSPVNAVLASTAGLALAGVVSAVSPDDAFPLLLGIGLFGGMATWLIIFASHLAFRRRRASAGLGRATVSLPGAPFTTVAAMLFVVGVLVASAFTGPFAIAWKVGLPFLVLLAVLHPLVRRKK
ncbi:amino acid permease [Streptomyces sp. NPDC054766]|uniref:amino acid permease n=1 Tax=Streptomyces rhizosphaerihabitans TaxID=1266770 RepID=UPI0021BFD0C8|nr:amino acid permease [Streptomyces rhizosphaerihabitans]MCT9008504.1 amino acid permease [Streptomyces rhizosphaerihabitans]